MSQKFSNYFFRFTSFAALSALIGTASCSVAPIHAASTSTTPVQADISITPSPAYAGSTQTLTATVHSGSQTSLAGKMTFTANSTSLGTATVSSTGVASISVRLAAGQYAINASYLQSGSTTSLQATAQVTVLPAPPTVSCASSPSTVALGDSSTITTQATAPSGTTLSYAWSVSGGSIYGSSTKATLNTQGASVGQLTVTCTATTSAGASASATTTVTVQPQVLSATVPESYFGLSVQNFVGVQPNLAYNTVRTWDAQAGSSTSRGLDWPSMSPSSGTYDFSALDAFIVYAQARNADIIYTFGRVPTWASTNPTLATCTYGPGQCAPPTDSAWEQFITAIVTHAAGRIKYWELWNEPNNPATYSGDFPTMVRLASEARAIITSLDPGAVVLSPATSGPGGATWLSTFLSCGGGSSIDVITFHGYGNSVAEDLVSIVNTFKSVASQRGYGSLPLWDTEAGWTAWDTSTTITDPVAQADYLAKTYLLQWSSGISRFAWYAYDGTAEWGMLWNSTTGDLPAATAYAQVQNWMVGASMTSACSKGSNGIWSCGLARPGGYEAQVLWNSTGTASWTTAAKFVQYRDLKGNVTTLTPQQVLTIGNDPILLETGTSPE